MNSREVLTVTFQAELFTDIAMGLPSLCAAVSVAPSSDREDKRKELPTRQKQKSIYGKGDRPTDPVWEHSAFPMTGWF